MAISYEKEANIFSVNLLIAECEKIVEIVSGKKLKNRITLKR